MAATPSNAVTNNAFVDATLEIIVKPHIQLLLQSPKTGFTSDDEYLNLLESIFTIFFLSYDSRETLSRNFLGYLDQVTEHDIQTKRNIYEGVHSLLTQLQNLMELRLSQSKPGNDTNTNESAEQKNNEHQILYEPRLERLASRLHLTPKEKFALQYIILHNIGVRFPSNQRSFDGRGMLRNMAIIADMSSREILNFLSPNRKHMKDGLFEASDDALSFEFSGTSFKMSKETLSAIMGCDLTSEQFLAVDNTTLGELLIEEGVCVSNLPSSKDDTDMAGVADDDTDMAGIADDDDVQAALMAAADDNDVFALLKTLADDDKTGDTTKNKLASISSTSASNQDVFALLKTLADDKTGDTTKNKLASISSTSASKSKQELREAEAAGSSDMGPYRDDLDYLKDHFKVIEMRYKAFMSNLEEQDSFKFTTTKSQKTTLRELRSQESSAYKKCQARLEMTKQQKKWLPRLERLVIKRNLEEFEKWVILTLVGCIISVDIIKAAGLQTRYRDAMTVGEMLGANCQDLRDQIEHRRYFYKTATLVKEDIIKVHESRLLHNSDLMHSCLEIDRRMVDYCVALDTEFGALVEGSSLYTPNVRLEQVILPADTKQLILDTIEGMEEFRKILSKFALQKTVTTTAPVAVNGDVDEKTKDSGGSGGDQNSSTVNGTNYVGNGIVILFHGISGTGKTMMANAIARHLDRKILLINYTKLAGGNGGAEKGVDDLIKLAFREAKIQNAVIFFDECEALFESRDRGNKSVNLILNAIESYDDLIMLATNRPFDLDEAMYRRIHLAVEFAAPDIHLREAIWRQHIPAQVQLADDVDLYVLSTEYELTGGFIRNAVLTALKNAMLQRKRADHDQTDDAANNAKIDNGVAKLRITQQDLRAACRQQIVGQLQLTGFNRRTIPRKSLRDIVLKKEDLEIVQSVINTHKSNKVLSGQWGFESEGQCILITGDGGVGKSTLAEVIAFECGKPMKVLTCSELLHLHRTTFGSKGATGADSVFSDLNSGAVLVIEGCEILFRDGFGTDNIINYLLFQIRRVTTMFIFICHGQLHSGVMLGLSAIQRTLFTHFHHVLKLTPPNKEMKVKLFLKTIPKQCPIDDASVTRQSLQKICDKFPKFTHSDIKRVVVKAAGCACLRKDITARKLTFKDLINAAEKLEKEMDAVG
eukprot:CAMPEP_0202732188 /NCGR_PEP_ID=MMETSP1385-20130828/187527_1 /ASSEMBLY_ACC=CAM_ASM_000861 /TAXON_ID=933848 /ORGANISM="Elphidium margaritaceum" /LENGTH=1162 /DNA_ID=CAMNT_0049398495 /DNA_START=24 /DNA_END=3510 /DNA_ORIENTATION=-